MTSRTLDAVQKIAPEIAERAEETEKNRSLAPDLIEKLRVAGVFRMMVPRSFGGEEMSQLQACRVIEELARADGAAGWTGMVAFGFNIAFSRFPAGTVAELYKSGADVLTRGALAPIGTATPVDGGFVISGRWPFASGSYKPKWVAAGCIVKVNGVPRLGPDGTPEMRLALVPAENVEFLDTWYSVGLRGSDSTDFAIKEQFVPEAYTSNPFNPFQPSVFEQPLHKVPFGFLTGPTHSAVCLGIAQGALDELGNLAKTKRGVFSPAQRLAEDPVFKHRFGELLIRLEAVRALTDVQIEKTLAIAQSGRPIAPLDFAENGAKVGYVHVQCVDIVNEAFSLAGSTPVYSKSALQRRWRDVRCAAQHVGGSTSGYRLLGGLMAGEEPEGPFAKPKSAPSTH
jgi:alkylation response protein AidB-like acyl-CoA dehydrogenase